VGLTAWSWILQKGKARSRFEALRSGDVRKYWELEEQAQANLCQKNYVIDLFALVFVALGVLVLAIPRLCALAD
jgi:hypothetical protein